MSSATRTGTGPTGTSAIAALYRLFLRGQLTRFRALALFALGALSIVLTAIASTSDDPADSATRVLAEYGLGVVAPISALWISSSILGDLVEDRLLVYLWLKPISRWTLPTAAVAASMTVLIPVVVLPLTVAAIVSGVGDLVLATLLASLLAVMAYSGLFVFFGLRFSRGLWWGLLYILVWENAVARIADGTAQLAVRSYVVSILSRATDVDLRLAGRSPAASVIVPVLVAVGGIAVSTWVLNKRDVD